MSLKTEIDKTNDLKNKTKKAKENINTKLIELGGQNATDLADVPNRIIETVSKYKRMAEIELNLDITYTNKEYRAVNIPINLNFNPSRIIVRFGCRSEQSLIADSKYNNNRNNMGPVKKTNNPTYGSAYIETISRENVTVVLNYHSETTGGTDHHYIYSILAIE